MVRYPLLPRRAGGAGGQAEPATKKALAALFQHGQTSLEQSGFLKNPLRKEVTLLRLRNLLLRMRLSASEVRLLRGVIDSLRRSKEPP